MLSRLRIGPKLLLAPGVVLLLLIVLSCGAYYAVVRQNQSLETIVQQRAVHIRAASELTAAAHQAHTEIYQLLTWLGASFSAARVDALVRDIHRRHADIGVRFDALSGVTEAGGAERHCIDQARAAHGLYVKAVQDVIELSRADPSMSANAMSKAERAFDEVALRLGELLRHERGLSERAARDAAAEFRTMTIVLPLVVLVSVGLSLAITMAVRRVLLSEISAIGDTALDLANGNLTVRDRVYGNDEIGATSRTLDTSVRNLNGTLRNILVSARSIDSASRGFGAMAAEVQAIVRMDDMTQQNAARVKEAAAAAASLQRQALSLARAVASFKLDEHGQVMKAAEPELPEGGPPLPVVVRGHLRLASSR